MALIFQYQEHLAELEQNIDALAGEIEEYDLIQSIPGFVHKIVATILSEIGEINRLIILKNLSPLRASIRVFSLRVSLRQPGFELPTAILGSLVTPWLWPFNADLLSSWATFRSGRIPNRAFKRNSSRSFRSCLRFRRINL